MKIYVYSPNLFTQDGAGKSLKQMIQGLSIRGHECTVLILDQSGQPLLEDVQQDDFKNIIVCGKGSGENASPVDPLIQAMLDLQETLASLPLPDVMMTLTPMCTAVARVVMNTMKPRPTIVSRVSTVFSKHDNYEQLIYADAHLAINSGIAEKIVEMNPDALVQTVYHPIHDENIRLVPRAKTPTFLYIGRVFNLQKRIDVLLRALAALPNKSWKLRLIEDALPEPGSSDEIRMKDLAFKLGIADRIEWCGYRESPWEEVDEATVLILPSDWEAHCYVLIEALIRGIPVISSDCPTGPRDIIQHGHNGWLFKPGDVLGLAGTINRIMTGSLTLPDADTCKDSIKHFDQDLVMDRIEQALYTYVGEGRKQIS